MNNQLFTFKVKDVLDALVNALVAGIVIGLGGLVAKGGFDVFNADWNAILHIVINSALAAFIGSLGKDFLTTSKGNLAGLFPAKAKN